MNRSLSRHLLASHLGIAVIPLLLLWIFSYVRSLRLLEEHIKNDLTIVAESKAALLNLKIEGLQNQLQLISQNNKKDLSHELLLNIKILPQEPIPKINRNNQGEFSLNLVSTLAQTDRLITAEVPLRELTDQLKSAANLEHAPSVNLFLPLDQKLIPVIDQSWEEVNLNANSGLTEINNYFIAWEYVPSLEGKVAIRIDRAEITAPLLSQQFLLLGAIVIFLVVIVYTARAISHSITSPIVNLTQIAQQMTNGAMDLRIKLDREDEIGVLGKSFNIMAERMQTIFSDLETMFAENSEQLKQAYKEIASLNQQLKQENKRLSTELDIVRRLQEMILPKEDELFLVHHLDISGYMSPAEEVGGDYYDVLSFDNKCLITIGDVTGHGLESGVFMLMAQTAVRTLHLSSDADYFNLLNVLNKTLYHNAQRMKSDRTMTLALLEYEKGNLRISGQHEEVILARHDGKVERIETIDLGFPLGLEDNISDFIQHITIDLTPGDVVVLYTDGITEAENSQKQQYGIDRLCRVIQDRIHRSAQEIRDGIVKDVLSFVEDQKIFDDMTLLVLKQKA